jgi:glycosyltransferase involved in cell wall biosynthesis
VGPGDLDGFARAVAGLLEDEDRARAIGEAAHERVLGHFLGTAGLLRYLSLFDRLLG